MTKMSLRLGLVIGVLALGLVLGLALGTTIWATHLNHKSTITLPVKPLIMATITIPRAQDLFEPFILTIHPGTTVQWQNNDSAAHSFTTTPDQNNFLNPQSFSRTVGAGKSVKLVFTKIGLYHYYETSLSKWNTQFSRVAANRDVPHFPVAMDGVIWVQGPINGLPANALNYIPRGHDDFAHEFVAISTSGTVSWHNFDEDPHFLGLVPSWSSPINPADIGLYRIAGTDDVPDGETVTLIFNKPGLYYYYCRNHDQIESSTHRVRALKKASEYPIPMEGFILVD